MLPFNFWGQQPIGSWFEASCKFSHQW
jgi:hypothetical protein